MSLHPTRKIERLIAAERAAKEALAELSDISTDADYLLEEAIAAIRESMNAVAERYGDDFFPPRSADSILRDHDYVLNPDPAVATSAYLNQTPRTLEEVEATRQQFRDAVALGQRDLLAAE